MAADTEPEPSSQLERDIQDALARSLSSGPRRPLLHHLNADSSWLLQLPRPPAATRRGGRLYYNILIDPWFTGSEHYLGEWFSRQVHVEESKVQSVREVDELIWSVEQLAAGEDSHLDSVDTARTVIDAVAISHEFMDHCHQPTLLEIAPDVPVFAAAVRPPPPTLCGSAR